MNDACGLLWGEATITPDEYRAERFGGVALSVRRGRKDPSRFWNVAERRFEVALEIGESDLAEEISGGVLFRDPVTKTEQRPMAGLTQQSRPGLFGSERHSADIAGDYRVGPETGAGGEVIEAMRSQR